jgi:hypothetical protein
MIPSLYQEFGTFGFEPFTTGQTVWDFSPNIFTTIYIGELVKTTYFKKNSPEQI